VGEEMILENQVVLVTGGTGSMGKTFVRRALSGKEGTLKKLIVFSRDEAKQHDMRLSFMDRKTSTDEIIYRNFQNILEFRIGDVRNYADLASAMHGVDIVINAAALKQVPVCEYFPEQAILTNCLGAQNIVRAITEHRMPVKTVLGVSTDKACKPVNVMGMTKAIQERLFIAANVMAPWTRFVCVRYGNVLASRGSVIPLFHEQIRTGGPVTITDKEMTRFLLTLEQAVDTVIACLKDGQRGDTFIPRVPSAKMTHVAKALVGDRKIKIEVTGIRPGEKLHESLVSWEESFRTYLNGEYYVISAMLPEVNGGAVIKRDLLGEYSSEHHVLDERGTEKLLNDHGLMYTGDTSKDIHELVA
jgi:FlaA1/EpsC-like NDP-sugar epimerase